jgi:hypothetical protein
MNRRAANTHEGTLGRLAKGSRRLRGRLNETLIRAQLGPTRETEWRNFSPGR